jgi:hypothetical protein
MDDVNTSCKEEGSVLFLIMHTWLVPVGDPTYVELWLVLETTWNQQSLAIGLHLEKAIVDIDVAESTSRAWLSLIGRQRWPISETNTKSCPTW